MLLRFQTTAYQRRLGSKIMRPNFSLRAPPVKLGEGSSNQSIRPFVDAPKRNTHKSSLNE